MKRLFAFVAIVLVGVAIGCCTGHRVNNTPPAAVLPQVPRAVSRPPGRWMLKFPGFKPVPLTPEEARSFHSYEAAHGPVDVRPV